MIGLVWGVEWRMAAARRRLFLLNVAVPLLLVAPVALSGAPAVHAAAVYAVLFVIHPTFGSAVPLVRDGERGLLARILRGGVGPAAYLLGRSGAGALLDVAQLAPAAAVAAWGLAGPGGSGAGLGGALPGILVGLVAAAWAANLVGVLVAAAARSVAETALFAAVVSLLLLHASGVFRTPPPGGPGAGVEAVAPFRLLHESLLAAGGGPAAAGGTAALLWSLALPAGVAAVSAALGRGLAGAPVRR